MEKNQKIKIVIPHPNACTMAGEVVEVTTKTIKEYTVKREDGFIHIFRTENDGPLLSPVPHNPNTWQESKFKIRSVTDGSRQST